MGFIPDAVILPQGATNSTIHRLLGRRNASDASSAALDGSISQQATGASLFWAMMALVINCMLQRSSFGMLVYGTGRDFEGALLPYRSSPLLCMVDAVLDTVTIVHYFLKARTPAQPHISAGDGEVRPRFFVEFHPLLKPRNGSRNGTYLARTWFEEWEIRKDGLMIYPSSIVRPSILRSLQVMPSNAILAMQAAVFFLGVAPQAIKIFSIQGILATQILAAIFLYSAGASMFASMCGAGITEGYSKAASWLNSCVPPDQVPPLLSRNVAPQLMYSHIIFWSVWWRAASVAIWKAYPGSEVLRNLVDTCRDIFIWTWIAVCLSTAVLLIRNSAYSRYGSNLAFFGFFIWPALNAFYQGLDTTVCRSDCETALSYNEMASAICASVVATFLVGTVCLLCAFLAFQIVKLVQACIQGFQREQVDLTETEISPVTVYVYPGHLDPEADMTKTRALSMLMANVLPPAHVTGTASQNPISNALAAHVARMLAQIHNPNQPHISVHPSSIEPTDLIAEAKALDESKGVTKIASAMCGLLKMDPAAEDFALTLGFTSEDQLVETMTKQLEDYDNAGSEWQRRQDGPFSMLHHILQVPTSTILGNLRILLRASLACGTFRGTLKIVGWILYEILLLIIALPLLLLTAILMVFDPDTDDFLWKTLVRSTGTKKQILWTAFALYNLTCATIYYFIVFDGNGTYNPGWVSALG